MTTYRIYYSKSKKEGYCTTNSVERQITRDEEVEGWLKMRKRVNEICDEILEGIKARKYHTLHSDDSSEYLNTRGFEERTIAVNGFTNDDFYHWYLSVEKLR